MHRKPKAVTLIELIIAIVLLATIALGFISIEIFNQFHVITTTRRARIQNEVSLALEHMAKEISRAIGNEDIFGADTVVNTAAISSNSAIRVYIDAGLSPNGQRDTANDLWIAYRFKQNQIWYCPNCRNNPCTACNPAWGASSNIIARNISSFTPTKPSNPLAQNFVNLQIQGCWDPTESIGACGTPDNPSVTMSTRIKMPSVSTN